MAGSTRSTSRSTTTGSKGATAAKSRSRAIAAEAEQFEEVTGGGDFPGTWDFEKQGDLVGTFLGTEEKEIKGEDRIIHSFEVDGETFNAWGAAILNSRLSDVQPGNRVKVVKSGKKIATKGGRQAWEYQVFVARGALAR